MVYNISSLPGLNPGLKETKFCELARQGHREMQIGKRGRVLTKSSLFTILLVLCVSVPLWLSFA